jgi:hypothetical protein
MFGDGVFTVSSCVKITGADADAEAARPSMASAHAAATAVMARALFMSSLLVLSMRGMARIARSGFLDQRRLPGSATILWMSAG